MRRARLIVCMLCCLDGSVFAQAPTPATPPAASGTAPPTASPPAAAPARPPLNADACKDICARAMTTPLPDNERRSLRQCVLNDLCPGGFGVQSSPLN